MGAIVRYGVKTPSQEPPMPTAPTQAEVSQATATEEQGLTEAQRARRRGRSATILTGPAGVEEQTATLGKKSLLGQ